MRSRHGRDVLAAGELADNRKRDRVKALAMRAMAVPLSVRTSDLPKRAGSAVVMLALAGAALWLGGVWFDGFVILVSAACLFEAVRLIRRAGRNASGALVVAGCAAAIIYIGAAAAMLIELPIPVVLGVIAVVVATDAGAYFSGRTIGGPKIAPRISPSKTWAGTIAGWVGAALVGLAFSGLPGAGFGLIGVSVAASMASQIGDIAESAIKRRAGVKDSSSLIPGHGGMMDRFDGMLGAAVFLVIAAQMTGVPPSGF